MVPSALSKSQHKRFLEICYQLFVDGGYDEKKKYHLDSELSQLPSSFCTGYVLTPLKIKKYALEYVSKYGTVLEQVELETKLQEIEREKQKNLLEKKKYYFTCFIEAPNKKRIVEIAKRNHIPTSKLKEMAASYYEDVLLKVSLDNLDVSQRAYYENNISKYQMVMASTQEKRMPDLLTGLSLEEQKKWCKKIFEFYICEDFSSDKNEFVIDGYTVSKRQIFFWKTEYYFKYASLKEKKECMLVDALVFGNEKNIFTSYREDANEFINILLALKQGDTMNRETKEFLRRAGLPLIQVQLFIDIYLKGHACDEDIEEKSIYLQNVLETLKEKDKKKEQTVYKEEITKTPLEIADAIRLYMDDSTKRVIDALDLWLLEKKYGFLLSDIEQFLEPERKRQLERILQWDRKTDRGFDTVLFSEEQNVKRCMTNQFGELEEVSLETKKAVLAFIKKYNLPRYKKIYIQALSRVMKGEYKVVQGEIVEADLPFLKGGKNKCV